MERLFPAKRVAAAVVGVGALIAASAAHARTDVHFSIGVPAAPVYAHPAPVYAHPAPVYVQPAPVYVQPRPVYVQPRPVYVQPRPVYVQPQLIHAPGHPRSYHGYNGWQGRGYHGDYPRHGRRFGPQGDLDRDGVPNYDDRDRDGDGVRNRHDRLPDDPYRY